MFPVMGLPVAEEKMTRLRAAFSEFPSALVAFSGGVDSTALLLLAKEAYGDQVLAVTVCSAGIPAQEAEGAVELAKQIGVQHQLVDADVLAVLDYANNTPERCYSCKMHVFGMLKKMAEEAGLAVVLDGTNADDTGDYRPGLVAAKELGVRSPLLEAGVTKDEVRSLLRHYNLPNWNKPAGPCLATRFPYGSTITVERLQQVWAGESFLRERGFSQVRVRHHGDVARIEVPATDMPRLLAMADDVVQHLRQAAGFRYVSLDLQGFRSGSMNEGLKTGA